MASYWRHPAEPIEVPDGIASVLEDFDRATNPELTAWQRTGLPAEASTSGSADAWRQALAVKTTVKTVNRDDFGRITSVTETEY